MIPLVGPHISWQDREYVKGRIDEGLLENETEVRTLEEAFAERFGYADAVAVNSGTNALIVALEHATLGMVQPHVAIPSYVCRAVWDACRRVGCLPVLRDNRCDVGLAEYHMNHDQDDTVTVLPHMFGRTPPDRPGGVVVEDLTLSLGAQHCPDNLSVCSLQADKMISAGRGGIILIPHTLADQAGEIRHRVAYDTHPGDLGAAHSFAMSSTQAAVALSQLRRLDGMIERRRETAAYYTDRLGGEGFDCPIVDGHNVFFRYLIGVEAPARAILELADRGVQAGRGVFPPLHRILTTNAQLFPGAEECCRRLLSLPVHPSVRAPAQVVDSVLAACTPA